MATSKTRQNHDAPWSDLTHDLVLLIMMKVGVGDFLAFSRVCKLWRSVTLSNRNMFMESRLPMLLSIGSRTFRKDCCYLEDSDGRLFKSTLRHSAGRTFIGLTCGYLILFGKEIRDFWLVNPITRHELHFPGFPFHLGNTPTRVRAILVFSPSTSEWVLVMVDISGQNWVSIARKAIWRYFNSSYSIMGLHAFKGKIYAITTSNSVSLNPKPKMMLLEFKKNLDLYALKSLVRFCENLFVIGHTRQNEYTVMELDTDEMKWVQPKKTIAYGFSKHIEHLPPFAVFDYFTNKSRRYKFFKTWYYTHDCMSVDTIHEVMAC